MNAAEILAEARRLIEPEGAWTKMGGVHASSRRGKFCVQTAISQFGFHWYNDIEPAMSLVARAAGVDCSGGWSALHNWNDAPERAHPEVLAAFSRAIELAGGRAT